MAKKPTYEELEKKVKHLESELAKYKEEKRDPAQGDVLDEFKRIADRSMDAIYHYDISSHRYLYRNKVALDLYGIEKGDTTEVSPKTVLLHIHPEDREKVKRAATDFFVPGCKIGEVGYRFQHTDGSLRWMRDKWIVIRDNLGKPIAIEGIVRDETERKRTEEALRESEEKYRLLIENMKDMIVKFDTEGRLLFVSQSYCTTFGKNQDELLGKKFMPLIHEEDREAVAKVIDNVCKPPYTAYVEERAMTKDGWCWQEWINTAVLNKENEVDSIIAVGRDISQQKQAEEALRESEKEYRSTLNNLLIGVVVHASDTSILLSNPEATNILGLTYEQMSGKKTIDPAWNFVHEDSTTMKVEDYPASKVFSTKKPLHDYVVGINRPDRNYVTWVIVNAIPVFSDDSELEKVVVNFVDITVRKQTEEALRESEKKYRTLIQNAGEAIIVAQDGVIKFANHIGEELYGRSQKELASRPLTYFIHEEDRKIVENRHERRLKGEELPGTYSFRIIAKNGDIKWVELNVVLFSWDDRPATLCFMKNITERKFAEEALRESEEKLARSRKMESMGLLAGGVAHDLNNVLSGIVSYPELILMDLPEDSKLRKPIETIQESGHRAAAIVQDLLTVARGVASEKKPLNLNDIVSDYLNSPEFNKLKQFHPTVMVKTNFDADLLNISCSHVHIRKVVMNLVSNASEAIEGSGNVTISTMNRYIDRPLRGYDDVIIGEYVVLAVSDDGSGISPVDLERIFEPFYTKKVMGRSGTGLGLAVAWNVMQDHQGYIDAITDENGTTFELYFPITRDEISDKDLSIPVKDYKGNGETILVVDDVESQREISCKMLDTLGYKTKAVLSGEEAVEYLKDHTVDLILLDMIMDPGINGRETYERIIEIHPKQKAIIVSGFAETDEVKEAQKLGAGQYIKKPFILEKIGLAVKKELEK